MAEAFCEIDIPAYVAKECGIERAGVIAVGLLDTDEDPSNTNLETLSWWTARLDASPATSFLIEQTRGEYQGGTPTEEEGFGTESTQVTGADHTATVEVEGLLDNRNFWEGVNLKKWKVVLFTNANLMLYIENPVTVYAKIMNPKNIKSAAFWSVQLKWQDISNPVVLETPDNLLSA